VKDIVAAAIGGCRLFFCDQRHLSGHKLMHSELPCVMFTYWGRRGPLSQFALELGRTALAEPGLSAVLSISRQNDNFESFRIFGPALFPVNTFRTNVGAVAEAWRIPFLRRAILRRIRQDKIQAVVELMPHIWTRFVNGEFRRGGVRYVTVIHDADPHPGDRTGVLNNWLNASICTADVVLTLSNTVARRLESKGQVPRSKIFALFHPDLSYAPRVALQPPRKGEVLRLLFLGRIMPYKGLSLFLDAVDVLREQGVAVKVGVFGEGELGRNAARLQAIDAEVVNRWLSVQEIGAILLQFHAVVLSHIEASQSGVAAAALGAGLPVIATPVGGLIEQINDGVTGVIAKRAEAHALAEAIMRLYLDPGLYRAICNGIARTHDERSMARFVNSVVSHAVP
jgi:glycosyltransferase involved in cell wall biosynthesis